MEPILNLIAKPGILPPQMTFTRASTATYVGSDGLIKTAKNNQLRYEYSSGVVQGNFVLYSQDLTQSVWSKTNSTVTANSGTAPDSTNTAVLLKESTSASSHYLSQYSMGIDSSNVYTSSIYVKAKERTIILFTMTDGGGNSGGQMYFDMANGKVTSASSYGSATNFTYGFTSVGNGWYRIWQSCQSNGPSAVCPGWVYLCNAGGANNYTGDGASGAYVWGPQFEAGSQPTTYKPTTGYDGVGTFMSTQSDLGWLFEESRTNMALYSEQFDNAAWSGNYTKAFGSGSIANATIAPDGTNTADFLCEDTNNSYHRVYQTITASSTTTQYTISVFAKASTRSRLCLMLSDAGQGNAVFAYYDLKSGMATCYQQNAIASSGTATLAKGGIQAYPNGWFRCWITGVNNTATSLYAFVGLCSYNTSWYAGDGTSGLYVWGAQIEQGSFPTSYIPTTSASATRSQDSCSTIINDYNGSEFSAFVDYKYTNTSVTVIDQMVLQPTTSASNSADRWVLARAANIGSMRLRNIVNSSVVQDCRYKPSDLNANKLCWSVSKSTINIVENGQLLYANSIPGSSTPRAVSMAAIGNNVQFTTPMSGYIKRITMWNIPLSVDKMRDMTSLKNEQSISTPSLNLTAIDGVTPPQLTVTRTTTATYTDRNGLVRTALANQLRHDYDFTKATKTTNLLLYSGQAENAVWTKQLSSITANLSNIYSPDGATSSADMIVEDSTSGWHGIYQTRTLTQDAYTFSIYAKSAGRNYLDFWCVTGGFAKGMRAIFNLSNGTVYSKTPCGPTTGYSANISLEGGGWYRCSITLNASIELYQLNVYMSTNGVSTPYQGDGVSGIYVWGAQLEQSSSVGVYSPTTTETTSTIKSLNDSYKGWLIEEARTNLVLQSQSFNTTWASTSATVSADSAVAPDGTSTADIATWASTSDTLRQNVTVAADSLSYTHSMFIKSGSAQCAYLQLAFVGGTTVDTYCRVNLITGVATPSGTTSVKSQQYANGWWRVSLTTANNGTNTSARLSVTAADSNFSIVTGSIIVWGSQFEQGTFPTSYIPTTSASVTRNQDLITASLNTFPVNTNEYTLFFDGSCQAIPGMGILGLDDGTTNNMIDIDINTGPQARGRVFAGGTSQSQINAGSVNAGVGYKQAWAVKLNDTSVCLNATSPGTSSSNALPTGMNRLRFGTQASMYASMCVKRVVIWPTRLDNSILQKITR